MFTEMLSPLMIFELFWFHSYKEKCVPARHSTLPARDHILYPNLREFEMAINKGLINEFN